MQFLMIQNKLLNMDKFSKVTVSTMSQGGSNNKITLWDKSSDIEHFEFGSQLENEAECVAEFERITVALGVV
jgi:hypothetical protein